MFSISTIICLIIASQGVQNGRGNRTCDDGLVYPCVVRNKDIDLYFVLNMEFNVLDGMPTSFFFSKPVYRYAVFCTLDDNTSKYECSAASSNLV